MSELDWYFGVDWWGSGSYSDETGALYDLQTERGRKYAIKSDASGFEPVMTGRLTCKLNNLDGRYDPTNTRSPLYPYVRPGASFRLQARYGANTYDVLRGRLSEITPLGETVERVSFTGLDGAMGLRSIKPAVALQAGQRVDQCIAAVLTACGWAGGSSLETYSDTIPLYWTSGLSAWDEIQKLCDATLGRFFVSAGGQAKYYSRLRGRYSSIAITEADIQRGVEAKQPWETVRNDVTLYIRPRTAQATAELWRMGDKPLVRAGTSLTVWANYASSGTACPAQNVVTPAATTDYTANSQANGGGTNLTANFTVTATKYGDRAKLVIANGGGTDGYVTLLKIRGDALTATATALNYQDAGSIATYEQRSFAIDGNWLQDTNAAGDILTILSSYLVSSQSFPGVRLRNQPALQFGADVFDTATVNLPSKGIAGQYSLGYIQHQWLERTGGLVETRFQFEKPYGAADYWIFPATLGVTTKLGA